MLWVYKVLQEIAFLRKHSAKRYMSWDLESTVIRKLTIYIDQWLNGTIVWMNKNGCGNMYVAKTRLHEQTEELNKKVVYDCNKDYAQN